MTDLLSGIDAPSDAELISRVRGGDVSAYGHLFSRHVDAARRLSRQLVRGPDSDDLVSDAFAKVLQALQGGGGPDVAFRAYLLSAVRRLHVDRVRASSRLQTSDDMSQFDPGIPFQDTAVASFESGAAARAFASLPERWQMVLWHLEVEGQKPADIAPLLGMSANSVSALAYRAREGLRQAFLTMHLADITSDQCRWVNEHLGGYVRNGLSRRDASKVDDHLRECRRCTATYLELTEVNSDLAGIIAPLLLGAAATGYVASSGAGGTGALLSLAGRVRDAVAGNSTAATVGGAVAAGVAAVAAGLVIAHGLSQDVVVDADRPIAIAPSATPDRSTPSVVRPREAVPATAAAGRALPAAGRLPGGTSTGDAPATATSPDPTAGGPADVTDPDPVSRPDRGPSVPPTQAATPPAATETPPAPESPSGTPDPTTPAPTAPGPTTPGPTDPPTSEPTTPAPAPDLGIADVAFEGTSARLSLTSTAVLPEVIDVALHSAGGLVTFEQSDGDCKVEPSDVLHAVCYTALPPRLAAPAGSASVLPAGFVATIPLRVPEGPVSDTLTFTASAPGYVAHSGNFAFSYQPGQTQPPTPTEGPTQPPTDDPSPAGGPTPTGDPTATQSPSASPPADPSPTSDPSPTNPSPTTPTPSKPPKPTVDLSVHAALDEHGNSGKANILVTVGGAPKTTVYLDVSVVATDPDHLDVSVPGNCRSTDAGYRCELRSGDAGPLQFRVHTHGKHSSATFTFTASAPPGYDEQHEADNAASVTVSRK